VVVLHSTNVNNLVIGGTAVKEKTFEEIVKEWEKFDAVGDEEEVDIGIEVDELPEIFR